MEYNRLRGDSANLRVSDRRSLRASDFDTPVPSS
jgi:hypothetical protein